MIFRKEKSSPIRIRKGKFLSLKQIKLLIIDHSNLVMALRSRNSHYQPLFWGFCLLALTWTLCLLFAGGVTTSIKAGMAFLDWPLSNGSLNPEGWTQDPDQLAEHSHRLLGMKVGLLAIVAAGWAWLTQERKAVRYLAGALLLVIISQGILGGARVKFDQLNIHSQNNVTAQTFAVLHACGAQLTLCLWVSLAAMTSKKWTEKKIGKKSKETPIAFWGTLACGLLFAQLVLGAIMRHADAALAIPTFPLTPEGGVFPQIWSFPVSIHFMHRWGGMIVGTMLIVFAWKILRHKGWKLLSFSLLGGVGVQVMFGGAVVWTQKNPHAATAHMLLGALLLALTWLGTFLSLHTEKKSPNELNLSSQNPLPVHV